MGALGSRLRQLRKQRGLTQQEAADGIGIKRPTYAKYETGENSPRDYEEAISKIASFYGVSVAYLLGETDHPSRPKEAIPFTPTRKAPVLGHVHAGEPMFADENIEDWLDLPEWATGASYFFLIVVGDCMEGPPDWIRDGDKVLVREQPEVETGEIAIVFLDDDEATIRRVEVIGDQILFKCDNPAYPTEIRSRRTARIVGRVVEHRRKL